MNDIAEEILDVANSVMEKKAFSKQIILGNRIEDIAFSLAVSVRKDGFFNNPYLKAGVRDLEKVLTELKREIPRH